MITAVYSHGRDGHPWLGQKIIEMRPVVLAAGINILSIKYDESLLLSEMISRCVDFCRNETNIPDRLVLIGSSRGGYIATQASTILHRDHRKEVSGLFLIAPAFYINADYYPDQDPQPSARRIEIVHGWHDPIISVENSIKFAKTSSAALHILDDEHRLNVQKQAVSALLAQFLEAVKTDVNSEAK